MGTYLDSKHANVAAAIPGTRNRGRKRIKVQKGSWQHEVREMLRLTGLRNFSMSSKLKNLTSDL